MLLLMVLILIAMILAVKLLPVVSTATPQVFSDFIIENVSESTLNKNGELSLFWWIAILGSLCLFFGLFFYDKYGKTRNARKKEINWIPFLFLLPFVVYFILYKQISLPLIGATILSTLFGFRKKYEKISLVLSSFAMVYYGILGIASFLSRHVTLSIFTRPWIQNAILICAFIFSFVFGIILTYTPAKNKTNFSSRLILCMQAFLPLLLCNWLVDKYQYKNELITLRYAVGYYVFFILLILICFLFYALHIIKYWNQKEASLKNVIHTLTPMLIFAFHSFQTTPMFAQPDEHHHGEQMIPWNQIFNHGQSLYDEYTPVSGLFPFVNGFFQHVLLDGTVTDYVPAISITMLLFSFLVMYLIYKHVGGTYALLFACIFVLPCYNRQYMVLPILLILTMPKLMEKKWAWILTWISTCFLAGLYYPLFGAAVLLGTTPMAFFELKGVIKEKAKQALSYRLLTYSGVLFLTIIASLPLLVRILKHTLTYSSQTITADGITLSNQSAPSYFLPWLNSHENLHNIAYLGIRFVLPAIGLWLLVYFIVKYKDLLLRLELIAGYIVLCVSYTYTLVRADVDKLLSRTAPILMIVVGMYLGIIIIKASISKTSDHKDCSEASTSVVPCGFLAICISIPCLLYMQISQIKNPDIWTYQDGDSQLVMDDASKICSYYEVPGNFLKSEDTDLDEDCKAYLGRGFMVEDQLHYIKEYKCVIDKVNSEENKIITATDKRSKITYMAFDGQGFFDYVNVACYGTGFIPAARSLAAQKEIWDSDPDNLPIVFYIQPEYNYYIFRWMLDSGYVYDEVDKAFYPKDIYDVLAKDNQVSGLSDYRNDVSPLDFGQSAISFAKSFDSLSELFEKKETDLLPDQINHGNYDVLYLEFTDFNDSTCDADNNYQLQITWTDTSGNHFEGNEIDCNFNQNQLTLLIPIGMNACWTLSDIDDFLIKVVDKDTDFEVCTCTYQEIRTDGMPSFLKELKLYKIK